MTNNKEGPAKQKSNQPLSQPTTKELLEKQVKGSIGTDSYPEDAHVEENIEDMFDDAMNAHPNNEFLESIYEWWQDKGFLTAKQYAKLLEMTE